MVRYGIKHALCVVMVSGSLVSSMSAMNRSVQSTQVAASQSNHFRKLTVVAPPLEENSVGSSSSQADEFLAKVRLSPTLASSSLVSPASAINDPNAGKAKPKYPFLDKLVKGSAVRSHEINDVINALNTGISRESGAWISPVHSRAGTPRDNASDEKNTDCPRSPRISAFPTHETTPRKKHESPLLNIIRRTSEDKVIRPVVEHESSLEGETLNLAN